MTHAATVLTEMNCGLLWSACLCLHAPGVLVRARPGGQAAGWEGVQTPSPAQGMRS